MTRYDHAGQEVDLSDILDREELADYHRTLADKPRRHRSQGVPVPAPSTWEPTEVDREAGREW
jgi:hypothetical protein